MKSKLVMLAALGAMFASMSAFAETQVACDKREADATYKGVDCSKLTDAAKKVACEAAHKAAPDAAAPK